ncbi:hypothetical protein Fmac_024547 [Flemingia macrophylla]|uniref:Uncharacterized protein n=1 Tax=Flemingia macrophylla TaxID=520843 RepID=A0ABD1LPR1_9FABA
MGFVTSRKTMLIEVGFNGMIILPTVSAKLVSFAKCFVEGTGVLGILGKSLWNGGLNGGLFRICECNSIRR